ncbi:MAG TPA: acyltransferase [Chitinophagaceae bacterium]|jgi:peptidoglycan/LPS O-acetylase OafA/YrhL
MPVRTYYPGLDGIRGLAILLVILYHNFSFITFLNFGWLGVDLFFVLSGFLITEILLISKNAENYFKHFYLRRILRIFPLYYLVLFFFLLIFPYLRNFPLDLRFYTQNQLWYWVYLENWVFIFKYDGKGAALNHFWSLAVEEQYYLIWPFIILFIKNIKVLLGCCLAALIFIILSRWYIWRHYQLDYNRLFLFTRIDGILIGSMLGIVYYRNQSLLRKYFTFLILLLAAFNFSVYLLKQDPNFPVWAIAGYTTFAAIFAMLIYECVKKENRVITLIFTNSMLRFLGKYSYGLYIFHWPVYLLIRPLTDQLTSGFFLQGSTIQLTISSLIASVAGLVTSILSYHLFEKHFLSLKKKFA